VCFLCGSLCGLRFVRPFVLWSAFVPPPSVGRFPFFIVGRFVLPFVLWSAFGPPPSVGRFPFFILSATFILCMSSTASAAVLSHMVPTWSGPEPSGPGLHDDVDHDHLHAPVVLAHVHRSAQPRSWAAVVAVSASARLDLPLSGAAASATAGADHDTQGAALLADPPLSGAAASATAGADHDTQGAALLAPGQLAALDPSPTKNIAQKLSIELMTHAIDSKPAELEPPTTKIFAFAGAPLAFVSEEDEASDNDNMPELEPIPVEPVKSARRIAAQRRIVKRNELKREAKKIYEQKMTAEYTIVANEWLKAK